MGKKNKDSNKTARPQAGNDQRSDAQNAQNSVTPQSGKPPQQGRRGDMQQY